MSSMTGLVWNFLGGLIFPLVVWTFENVALHKTAWQQHSLGNNEFNESLALDGRKGDLSPWGGECVASGFGETAEWRVDLSGILSIHHIVIQYVQHSPVRDEDIFNAGSFLGFSLYISNTSTKEDGVLCFKDTNYTTNTIPNPINITCPYHGRYVIYYNNRTHKPYPDGYSSYAFTDLCEVEVFGCSSPGVYGENCSIPCPRNCQESYCHITEGTCLGCEAGYKGVTCNEECPGSRFGQSCVQYCSKHCLNSGICDPVKGHCIGGCQAGWKNAQCDQICESGMFGKHCNKSCSRCLKDEQCHHINGSCLNGCNPGFKGMNCIEECPNGNYGQQCKENCSMHCRILGECDKVAGHCLDGCQVGWKNALCDQKCDGGMFGINCKGSCGKCLNDKQCNHINGSCLNGCEPGYSGINCTEECTIGLFGVNCEGFCSPNCKTPGICDKVTGRCEGGCQAGWTQRKCDTECPDGLYGYDCKENCSTNCIVPGRCDGITGRCDGGCQDGWTEPKCDIERDSTLLIKSTPTHGQTNLENSSVVTTVILTTTCLIIVVVVLFIGRRRWQSEPQDIERNNLEMQEDRTEINIPMTNNLQEYETSTLYTNDVQSSEQEITQNVEFEFVSIKKSTERPEDSEVCLVTEQIANADQVEKYSITSTYDTCSKNSPDILVNQMHKTIAEMKKCENQGFKREYSTLNNGELFPCDVGKRNENVSKNRYKTTLPYDHARVIIYGDNESSEYINASFIEDSEREHAYIATQGPKENTVDDFWRMVWQQNVSEIVMLTNLMERGKIKCSQYWPDSLSTELYGRVTIINVLEKHYAFHTTRKFVLSHDQEQMSRDIIQYHYTMWLDHGTPEPLSLALFHSQVLRTSSADNTTPIVVHCSAGIGRTGTFIALDALYKEGKRTGKINVMKYVNIMRSCRMNMVQTYEQYMTIFMALNERFKACLLTKSLSTFDDKLGSALSLHKPTWVKREFKTLLHIRPEYTIDDYLEARQNVNQKDSVLPLDKYMLYLTSSVANRGSYINAIAVSSYLQNDAFIVTHFPPSEDAVDFLRLLIDHESNIVICMDPFSQIESSNSWLPGSLSDKMVEPLSVHCVAETETDVKVTDIRILTKEGFSHAVSIVEPRVIQGFNGTPINASSLRKLVSHAISVSTEGPITVISKDGASLCGAFCAVFNCIQQINMDDSVDVFTAIRQLQTRRPEFCSTLDEYLLVYRALCDYIGTMSENIYENM